MRQMSRGNRRERGSAMVELALSLLAFLLLTLGSMEFGWAIYSYNYCSFLAQSGARWASTNGSMSPTPATLSSLTAYIQSQSVGMDLSLLTVGATWTPDNNPGSDVTVTVGYTIKPLAGFAIKQNFNVLSTAEYVINH